MTYSEVDRSMLLRCLDAELWRKTQDVRAIFVSKTQNSPKLYVIERMLTDLVGSQLVEHRINPVGRFSEYRLAPGAASKIESNTGPQAGALVLKEFV